MRAQRRKISMGVTQEEFYEGEHICVIYNDDKERLDTIAKYLNSGLEAGEKMMYMVDEPPDEFMDAMAGFSLDIGRLEQDLSLAEAYQSFCPDGDFDPSGAFNRMADFYRTAMDEGYAGARGGAEMTWASVEGRAEIHKVIELEARRNQVLKKYPFSTCCVYDAREFDGSTIMDVLNTHPAMIVKGQMVRNPYYIEPEIFLERLKERGEEINA